MIPVLYYSDVRAAAAWLCRAFGFVERLEIGSHRAQLLFGGGAIVAADGGSAGPPGGWPTHSIMVRVTGIDRHHAAALAGGATVTMAPADQPFGERQYSAIDLAGHRWTFSETIGDSDPATWGGILKEPQ